MHKLIIEDDEGRATVVPLVRDELTIGRKEGNTIRLTERNVSRRHARLFRQDDEMWVEDFGSYTGTRINGTRISSPVALRDSDQVLIGDYKLQIRSEGTADAIPPTVPGIPSGVSEPSVAATGAGAVAPAPGPAEPSRALDAAPTIPLRTLEEQGRAPKVPGLQPARLVVVTTELAGMEFPVERASLVIGRTEENDIILNHASISRHHAKIVRDGDRYTVVDLQSANGVRVGGESYERVDVQPGDVVELGHVKLRFVGPLEDWAFDPHDFVPTSRRTLKLGAAAGGIVLAGILIFALQGKKTAPAPAPAVVVAVPQIPAAPSPAALFAEATAAVASENWDKAVSVLDLMLSRPSSNPEAAAITSQAVELKRKVDLERRSAEAFASFEKAVADKEPDVAMSHYDEIPPESVYKVRAEPALGGVKTLFLAAHMDLADAARTQGRCDDASAEVEKVLQIDPENKKAHDIVKRCKQRVPLANAVPSSAGIPARIVPGAPAATPPRPTAPTTTPVAVAARPPTAARPVTPRPARPAGSAARNSAGTNSLSETSPPAVAEENQSDAAAELIRQARDAWMHQQCGTATDLSRRALKLRGNPNEAHQIIAVCACSTKDKDSALKSYSKLDERSRTMVRTLCARNGVELIE